MTRRSVRFAVIAAFATVAASAHGQTGDWGNLAIISSTLGNNANRLCVGEGLRDTDIGCPTYAPYVSSSGNVGIGTTAPAQLLTISGTSAQGLRFGGSSGSSWDLLRYTSGGLQFQEVGQAVRLTLYPGGNVGIGTTNPNAKLDVYGTISATNLLINGQPVGGQADRITSGATRIIANNNSYISVTVNGIDVARFNQLQGAVFGANGALNTGYWAGSSVSTTATFLRNGDSFVSIRSLDNAGNAGLLFNGAGYRGTIYGTPGYDLYISPNDQYVRADVIFKPVLGTNGMNVGINTDAPQATLQVSGSFIVSTSAQTTTPSLYVGTNGNVGVGTDGPAAALHVRSANANGGNGNLVIDDTNNQGAATGARITFRSIYTGSSITQGAEVRQVKQNSSAGDYGFGLAFATRPHLGSITERLRVDSSGNVGVGTTTPSTTLHVSGTLRISNGGEACDANRAGAIRYTSSSVFQFCMGSGWQNLADAAGGGQADRITSGTTNVIATQDRSVTISTAGTQRVVIGENGNVGIGTATPHLPLLVNGQSGATQFNVTNTGTGTFLSQGSTKLIERASSNELRYAGSYYPTLTFYNSGAEAMRISSGNVGIGTTTPTATLQVSGSFIVSTSAQTTTPSLYVGTNGNVGIGTSNPAALLDVNIGAAAVNSGNFRISRNTGDYLYIKAPAGNPTAATLGIKNASEVDILSLVANRRVGIGTTTPSATLMVSGSAIVSGTVQVAGTGNELCTPGMLGTIRFNPVTGAPQICVQR